MKNNKLLLLFALTILLFASCKKGHYDVSQVQGVNAEGEVLLPVASASYSVKDLMERFEIDSLITFSEGGTMSMGYEYEIDGAVKGSELLCFKDWNYAEHITIENPFPGGLPHPVDTVVSLSQTVVFEADHIHVLSALMKSGSFAFAMNSDVANLGQVVVTSPNITDAQGNNLNVVFMPQVGYGFINLAGYHYHTSEANTVQLNYEFHVVINQISVPEIEIDVEVSATDLTIKEMSGYVDEYDSRNRIDTIFDFFPDNLSGNLEIAGANLRVNESNTFPLSARLVVDTALVYCEGIAPYSLFNPMPVVIDLAPESSAEVYNQNLNGTLSARGGRALASSLFTVNPGGQMHEVTVSDDCNIDVGIDVEIPFSFKVDHVGYLDTVNMNLEEIEFPDLVEQLALELTFVSTLPLNLHGQFYMYDSQNEMITDTLVADGQLIAASYDGQPTRSTVCIEVDGDKIESILHSDRIIMRYDVDTDAHDVVLKTDQRLELYVKAKAKYNGIVEF